MSEKQNKNSKVSLSQVASAAGVSKMTASRVLRDEGGYSEMTRERVMEKVDVLGYLPNRLTTVFAGDQSSTFVGVCIPDLGNEVVSLVLEGIDRKLGSFGHQNDTMAFGGMQFCTSKNLRIPEDIGIARWGDLPVAAVLPKRMTSMHVLHLKLGQVAAEMMLSRLSGEPTPHVQDIGFSLIPGSTVRNSQGS